MGEIVARVDLPGGAEFQLVHGDLTQTEVDAIVNAANRQLGHGGGVAAAIVRAGGAVIQEESDRWVREHGPIDHGSPALTSAGDLPCQAVIHIVGPRWGEGDHAAKLRTAVQAALRLADQRGFKSLALPPVSTGIFGYPADQAAGVIFDAIAEFFINSGERSLTEVRLVIIDQATLDAFASALRPRFRNGPGAE